MTVTPKTHELKVWPEYFAETWSGNKPFEVRRDDRGGFGVEDVLLLREYEPGSGSGPTGHYSGRELTARVTYVLPGDQFGIVRGYVVLGLSVLQRSGSPSGRIPKARP